MNRPIIVPRARRRADPIRLPRSSDLRFVLGSLAVFLSSCTTIYDRHHLRYGDAVDAEASHPESKEGSRESRPIHTANYYRVTITGWTLFSASQYASGWFDRDAVDSLFGELKGAGKLVSVDQTKLQGHVERVAHPPAGSTAATPAAPASPAPAGSTSPAGTPLPAQPEPAPAATASAGQPEPAAGAKPAADPSKEEDCKPARRTVAKQEQGELSGAEGGNDLAGKKLVIFLSTNADSLVNRISQLTSSTKIQNSLVGLLLRPDLEKLEFAKIAASKDRDTALLLQSRLEELSNKLAAAGNATALRVELLDGLVLLAQNSASSSGWTGITNVATAEAWRTEHPGAFKAKEVQP